MYYHVWFATKYRRPSLTGRTEKLVKSMFSECIKRHKYDVLEFESNTDHMHLLVNAQNKKVLAGIVRTLKSVSAKEVLRDVRASGSSTNRRAFWARRYGWKEVEESVVPTVRRYIRNQKGASDTTGGSL
jgi:putative transposase